MGVTMHEMDRAIAALKELLKDKDYIQSMRGYHQKLLVTMKPDTDKNKQHEIPEDILGVKVIIGWNTGPIV